eukprot:TRINITY_DN5151_c0_g1_i4.p2 TRINITY_DN5151_c0_g1~~TRINITY_DN5151_c0_g1_i4.p2  ORF type:complete len:106 (+),score=11.58 TRINITY_DN5151_c0_g1_i4:279-596(+)
MLPGGQSTSHLLDSKERERASSPRPVIRLFILHTSTSTERAFAPSPTIERFWLTLLAPRERGLLLLKTIDRMIWALSTCSDDSIFNLHGSRGRSPITSLTAVLCV